MSSIEPDDRWQRLSVLFDQGSELPGNEVAGFCERECGDDPELRDMLHDLLTSADIDDERVQRSVSNLATEVATEPSIEGERLGAYRVDELIARGGMGEVYLATRADGQFEKSVAVKVVSRKLNEDEYVAHFQTELRVLARLQHPYVPALIDAGQLDDGRPYFMAEYVDGIPIDEYCDEHRLSTKQRLALFDKLGDAVQHAHSNLVLHLDIKPANVLIRKDATPQLLDFGITRLIDDPETGHRACTPDYASPEQLVGETPTAASDVYALGVLLYQLLTGQKPFDVTETLPPETKLAARSELAESVSRSTAVPGLDPDLRAIVQKATSYSPAARYRTVESLLSDLRRYRNHLPVTARQRRFSYVFRKYLRRHWVALSVTTSIIAILLAFGIREIQLRTAAQAAYAQAELEAETLRQVSDFLTNLFKVSDPGEARGNTVTARELLDRGAERIVDDLNTQPEVRTRLMRTMGDVYSSLGLYGEAVELDEQALSLRLELLGPDHPDVAETLFALGALYSQQARYQESEAAHLRALAIREKVFDPEHPAVAESLNGLAQVSWYLGQAEVAEAHYLRALQIREAAYGADQPQVANSLVHLGWFMEREGRFDEAHAYLSRGLSIRETALGKDHYLVAENLDLLAQIDTALGEHEQAEAQLLRALAIREKVLEASHPDIGTSLLLIGRLYRTQQRYEEALLSLRRAERHFANALASDHFQVAVVLEELGLTLAQTGRWADAETAYRRQLDILQSRFSPDHTLVGACLNNLGWVLSDGLQRYAEGERVLRDAVTLFSRIADPDDYWNALSRWSLANNLRDQQRYDEADGLYREARTILERSGGSVRVDNPNLDELLRDYARSLHASGRGAEAEAL
ncbi:MAG: serine/threonine-protein kinase [Pseudomonadota bacterium]